MASSRATHSQTATRGLDGISSEEGFGLVEVIVATLVLVVGVLSSFLAYEASQRATGRGERTATLAHRAQSEIERITAMPYASVGMESIPTNSGSGNPKDPLNYVVNSPAGYQYDWAQPSSKEPFVNGGSIPTSSAWTDGNLSGKMYRFVTWVSDPCASCVKSQDYKRVTAVVTTPGTAAPLLSSTIITK
jgi:Tfp pilus assembly protein PilE